MSLLGYRFASLGVVVLCLVTGGCTNKVQSAVASDPDLIPPPQEEKLTEAEALSQLEQLGCTFVVVGEGDNGNWRCAEENIHEEFSSIQNRYAAELIQQFVFLKSSQTYAQERMKAFAAYLTTKGSEDNRRLKAQEVLAEVESELASYRDGIEILDKGIRKSWSEIFAAERRLRELVPAMRQLQTQLQKQGVVFPADADEGDIELVEGKVNDFYLGAVRLNSFASKSEEILQILEDQPQALPLYLVSKESPTDPFTDGTTDEIIRAVEENLPSEDTVIAAEEEKQKLKLVHSQAAFHSWAALHGYSFALFAKAKFDLMGVGLWPTRMSGEENEYVVSPSVLKQDIILPALEIRIRQLIRAAKDLSRPHVRPIPPGIGASSELDQKELPYLISFFQGFLKKVKFDSREAFARSFTANYLVRSRVPSELWVSDPKEQVALRQHILAAFVWADAGFEEEVGLSAEKLLMLYRLTYASSDNPVNRVVELNFTRNAANLAFNPRPSFGLQMAMQRMEPYIRHVLEEEAKPHPIIRL